MRVTAAQLKAGQFVFVGETELARAPWDVVQVHQDGSATVRVEVRRRDDPMPVVSSPVPVEEIDHRIVYVRGPLSRRYRCKGCDWVGALPAEHP